MDDGRRHIETNLSVDLYLF